MANRTLEFRCWDGKKMYYRVVPWQWDFCISLAWHRCEKSTGSGILGSGGDTADMLVPAVRFTHIMQATGLKDKAGKELYEGDIVQAYRSGRKDGKFEIRYMDRGFVMWQEGDESSLDCIWFFEFEIIGNIYENKNLLSK